MRSFTLTPMNRVDLSLQIGFVERGERAKGKNDRAGDRCKRELHRASLQTRGALTYEEAQIRFSLTGF